MTQDELYFFSGHGGALPLYVALREQVLARWPEVEIKAEMESMAKTETVVEVDTTVEGKA